MTHVGRGSRLVLRAGDRTVTLRALADLDLDGEWSLPVLALVQGADGASGDVEVTTAAGVVTLGARLVHDGGGLALVGRAGDGDADPDDDTVAGLPAGAGPDDVQRRNDVRGPVALPVRAAVLDARLRRDLADLAFEGATLDVSAGGVRLDPGDGADRARRLPAGARLFVELELPDGTLVPAVVGLVEPGASALHGASVDIAAADRERLVRLVFAEQRRMLAARPRTRSPLADLLAPRRDPYGP